MRVLVFIAFAAHFFCFAFSFVLWLLLQGSLRCARWQQVGLGAGRRHVAVGATRIICQLAKSKMFSSFLFSHISCIVAPLTSRCRGRAHHKGVNSPCLAFQLMPLANVKNKEKGIACAQLGAILETCKIQQNYFKYLPSCCASFPQINLAYFCGY